MIGTTRAGGRRAAPLLAACALALLAAGAVAQEPSSLAVLLKVQGTVEHRAAGGDGWTAAQRGGVLSPGDRLRTGIDGAAALLFVDDRSLLKLDAETEVAFQARREGEGVSKRLWMGAGELWAKVTRSEAPRFEVETPTSVASVKGSEFYCLEDPSGGNIFHALSGSYRYGNEHGTIDLAAGRTGLSDGEGPPRSRPTDPGELPGFGGVQGYGVEEDGDRRTIRIEFENEDGEQKTLVIPLDSPE